MKKILMCLLIENNSFSLNKHSLSFMNNKWIFQNKENFNEKLT